MTAPEVAIHILRLPEVVRRTGLGRDTVYRLARNGAFPKPLKLSERASGWIESEIDQWVADLAAKR